MCVLLPRNFSYFIFQLIINNSKLLWGYNYKLLAHPVVWLSNLHKLIIESLSYWHLDARKAARHGIPGDGFVADGSEHWRLLAADPPDTCHKQITTHIPSTVTSMNLWLKCELQLPYNLDLRPGFDLWNFTSARGHKVRSDRESQGAYGI